MGFLVDEKKFINDNVFLHEERLNSQYTRFLESSPTYVTYYHINNIESIVDSGFGGVERILGPESPLRFNEVKDFPIYGIDQIVLNLNKDDNGFDTDFDATATILPNTIKPLPNDMFTISYLNQNYIFMVTQVEYDTIKSNNFYRISFTVNSLTENYKEYLVNQTGDMFNCIVDNIGTNEKVLIRADDVDQLVALDEIYTNIAEQYKLLFFNKKYNSFMYNFADSKIYDRYLTEFVNKTGIFNEKKTFDTVYLTNEDKTNTMQIEYHKSIYRAVEAKKKNLVPSTLYGLSYINNPFSMFSYYRDGNVRSIQFSSTGTFTYIRPSLIEKVTTTGDTTDENVMSKTIIDFFNDKVSDIYGLDRVALRDFPDFMDVDQETFVLIPILLYILRFYYNKFMSIS
jgi:hypothetical protein